MPEATHRFRVGDRVQVEPANPAGNPRTPAYIRGKSGVVTSKAATISAGDSPTLKPPIA